MNSTRNPLPKPMARYSQISSISTLLKGISVNWSIVMLFIISSNDPKLMLFSSSWLGMSLKLVFIVYVEINFEF